MTRKCIMCKCKNYKNSHSFFSAPKDAETRRLWQEAINIKDYTVNEDTYVCSKHFTKDDIITHWVSGVPPQVITIKYKKCRLRPGAVPIPESQTHSIILDGKKYLIEPKKKDLDTNIKVRNSQEASNESLNCNLEDEIYEYIPEDAQEPEELDVEVIPKKQKVMDKNPSENEEIICSSNASGEIMLIDCTKMLVNSTDEVKKNKSSGELDNLDDTGAILRYFPKRTYIKVKKGLKKTDCNKIEDSNQNMNSSISWHDVSINEKFDILKSNMNELNENLNKNDFESIHPAQEIIYCDNTLSFEEFTEIYNEVSLPSSWFASMVSKGNDVTVVYCCMNISSTGMPYVEKKTFLSNDMVLRCAVFDKEISINKILKSEGNLVINTLSDIEEFIKEFDQMRICPGIISEKFVENNERAKVTLDACTWSECSIILSEDQVACVRCASLMKGRKTKQK